MRPLALFHVGLCVADIERSLAFYRDIVGLRAGEIVDHENPNFDELSGNPGTNVRVVYLTNGPWTLQLIEYVAAGGPPLVLAHNRPGCGHLCFYVEDADAKRAELVARGDVTITSDVVQLGLTMRSFYTMDPDGLPVEFLQLTGGATHESVLRDGRLDPFPA
jgi:catechol 2,3-dioxygenase-like lactoylglutathione lyase family enzyme